jgi:hypothetical protein
MVENRKQFKLTNPPVEVDWFFFGTKRHMLLSKRYLQTMRINIKTISFVLSIPILLFVSCITDDTETRTYEEEMVELDELLSGIIAEGSDVDTTELGIYYVVLEEGEGAFAVESDTVSIVYEGYLNDGTLFDASANWYTDGVWEFVYGEQSLISGFNDALSVMNKNRIVQFYIPSNLAYGAYGSGSIGAYQTLIFILEMEDLKHSTI